jgi:hypothetical protein
VSFQHPLSQTHSTSVEAPHCHWHPVPAQLDQDGNAARPPHRARGWSLRGAAQIPGRPGVRYYDQGLIHLAIYVQPMGWTDQAVNWLAQPDTGWMWGARAIAKDTEARACITLASADRASARRRVTTIAQLFNRWASPSRLRQAALGGVSKHHASRFRPPRLCVQPAALACALFGGTADGRAHDHGAYRARNLCALPRKRPETGHDDRAALQEDGHRPGRHGRCQPRRQAADAAIAAASCARPRARRGCP